MTSLRRTGGAIILLFALTVTGSAVAWADDLDPSDGDPGACPFYREPPHLRSPPGDGPGMLPVRSTLAALLGIYGGLAALWAAVLLRWRLARLFPYELPVLTAATAAAMLVLGVRWDRTDAIGIAQVTVTDPTGSGIERTQVNVNTRRQSRMRLTLPYPKSALRARAGAIRFGSPLRRQREPAIVEREMADDIVVAGIAPYVILARPLAQPAEPLLLEVRDGRPWVVNRTSLAYTNVTACLGRAPKSSTEPAARWWTLNGELPAGAARELARHSESRLLGGRDACQWFASAGRYQIEAVAVSPGELPVRSDPPLPQEALVVRMTVGELAGEVAGP